MTVIGAYSWARCFEGRQSILNDLYGTVGALTEGARKTKPIRILADEDWVIVEARGEMTARSGAPYNNHYCLMYRLEEGMIKETHEYQDSVTCETVLGPFPG